MIDLCRSSLRSGSGGGHGLPMRHCADAINVSGKSGSSVMWGDDEISERREDRDETLQAIG
jgi:hypothetical protein